MLSDTAHFQISTRMAPLRDRAVAAQRAVAASPIAQMLPRVIPIAILTGALYELYHMDWHAVLAIVPHNPLFWAVFLAMYLTPPTAEWLIYRQIWPVPRDAFLAMLRKGVSNDLLFGYVGEAYLYGWARRAGRAPAEAFGAVKDVSILSAAVGSTATLVVAALTAPLLAKLQLPIPAWSVVLAMGLISMPLLVAVFGRKRVFHLPGAVLVRIAGIHALRSATGLLLTALVWHLALPGIAAGWWVVMSALRLLLSRLPLSSNKELVFAATITALLGNHGDVPALMAMLATLTVGAHVLAGLLTSAGGVAQAVARVTRPLRFA